MPDLEIAKSKYNERITVDYKNEGLELYYMSQQDMHHPMQYSPLKLSWEQWEFFVAWVELKRKEEILQKSLQGNSPA